jgi:hypothetical protein
MQTNNVRNGRDRSHSDRSHSSPSLHDKLKQAGAKPGLINFVDYAFACGMDISEIAIRFLKNIPATSFGLKPPESSIQLHEQNWMDALTEKYKSKKTGWIQEDMEAIEKMFKEVFKNAPIINIDDTTDRERITVYTKRQLSDAQIGNLREVYKKPIYTIVQEATNA